MKNELATIRSKKIGLLLKQMRESHGHSDKDCANWLGLSLSDYQAMETGDTCASLPQIESLAYYLDFPFEFLTTLPTGEPADKDLSQQVNQELVKVRNKTIAIVLKQKREAKNLTVEQLAQSALVAPGDLYSYEDDGLPVPFSSLLSLLDALDVPLGQLFSQEGPFKHEEQQPIGQGTAAPTNLTAEMQDFIAKPANMPYLELAMRLSKLDANKIRSIASSLLEITY
jgi:transcriptional regulator with XRE-family HTH domain/DNA-binding XRE family transcriptional regulator